MNENYIVCKKVYFYSQLDESIFFTWIKNISCIKTTGGVGDELYLYIIDEPLNYEDMKNLIALLYRYKIDMRQLQPLITEHNKDAVIPWKRQIYKT
ncbi:hypothetical protein KBD08_01610 [Candidatus Babeliales bacterium]|nr:hypothetical protein [Candidatus Babeliales bacterium]